MGKIILTKEGLAKLKKELAELTDIKRPKVAKRIQQAKGYGDLSENVEYDEAKNEQLVVEKRISELSQIVKRAEVPARPKRGLVGIGSRVTIDCQGQKSEYILVGDFEAYPSENRISHSSPIGRSLIGHKLGDKIKIEIPAGTQRCQITKIEENS
jgi:transcription elongation factor GreA